MKIFAFFMAMIVLTLSILPCRDAGAVSKSHVNKEIQMPAHQDSGVNDECSPFCHCTCCAGFSINHFPATIEIISQHENRPETAYLPSNILEISLPVWQPPQLIA